MELVEVIDKCKAGNREAFRELYELKHKDTKNAEQFNSWFYKTLIRLSWYASRKERKTRAVGKAMPDTFESITSAVDNQAGVNDEIKRKIREVGTGDD